MLNRLDFAPCGIVVLDSKGDIVQINQTLLGILGYETSQLIGVHFEKMLSTISRMVFHSIFYPSLHVDGSVKELLIKCNHSNGGEISFMLSARFVDEDGKLVDCVLLEMNKRIQYEQDLKLAQLQSKDAYKNIQKLMSEIEMKQVELLKLNEELTMLSNTDKLTGLKNRRYFQERLDQLYKMYIQTNQSFFMLVIDIDFFKKVNDAYGHHAGDEVLAQLAAHIQEVSSNQLEVFRFGGEEFVVLLTAEDEEYAKATAEHIRLNVEQTPFSIGHITISIGGAKVKQEYSPEALFDVADKALYLSKQNGRNQVTFLI